MRNLLLLFTFTFVSIVSIGQVIKDERRILVSNTDIDTPDVKPGVGNNDEGKSTACSNTSEGTINLVDRSDIGDASFSAAALLDVFDAEAGATSPTPSCGNDNNGSWHVYDLAPGVAQISVDYAYNSSFSGSNDIHMSFYQGADCSSLTNLDCKRIIEKSGASFFVESFNLSGLDDSQKLWIFTFSKKTFDIDLNITGMGAAPVNENCAAADIASSGCNLGASGAAFTTPSTALGAGACDGGTWYSNENTVFYTFTASETSGTIDIANLTCNDGSGSGEAQIGVWDDCASVGLYDASYKGCAVGTGTVTLPSLNVGDSYIIAVDGQAGDACKWDFLTTGIVLPVELISLNAQSFSGYNRISWSTATEHNSDYFEIQRSDDGKEFYAIGKVSAAGNTLEERKYEWIDRVPSGSVIYYRLKQLDFDGRFDYHGPKSLYFNNGDDITVIPNPVESQAMVSFGYEIGRNYVYSVQDLSGRVVLIGNFNPKFKNETILFQTDDFKKGMYILTVNSTRSDAYRVNFVKK
ncbi:MAG: T9SS type A sorting domain-containing protein [Crocinitomicaceae bacterium]|nr:T9SS type A sorting domain-containing protein [Crocinitomicaceae bacterium]